MTQHNKNIILASSSPRRRELLRQVGLTFAIDPADVDEAIRAGERPEEYAIRVAIDKAEMAASRVASGLIIAADTIVVLDDRILGKPADSADAERMLSLLSGRKHEVMTGVVVRDATTGRNDARLAVSSVWFRHLSEPEIKAYVKTGEPLDKAGAYGIQEKGAVLVDRIEGCYFNIVGLPLSLLGQMLNVFGITLL